MTLPFHAAARAVACAALALPACIAIAQASPTADPPAADPHAAVPATRYENPIGYRVDPAPQAGPDRAWVRSNATVAGMNAMSLTMKGMRGAMPRNVPQQPHSMPAMPAPAPAAAPKQPDDTATPHKHTGMHDHGAMKDDMKDDMPGMPMPAGHHHQTEGQ